ncbi:MAG: peptidylprolyl isomerase [Kiritimatiellia bacterium]|jgi:peptidyl-prolyl cis-trans isomerase C|nr:peptidylprolyl isomerase [Kiritimatiellia bacterium]MDP6809133.1 peptidylprolyl isomerase [Kiritimatiellia bacterium]MDP7023175.1 peptidylprolyl isomerase [Kiritimatiellia bacterium]
MQIMKVAVRVMLVAAMGLGLVSGCGKKTPEPEVVASVNGVVLTRPEMQREVDVRMAAMKGRIPEEKLEESRNRMAFMVTDQFVVRTILVQEAEKLGVTASDDEVQQALAKVKTNLPPGKTYEDMVASSVGGEAGLIGEITAGLRINKLLESALKEKLAISDEEVTAFMVENKARLQRPERVRARHILLKTEEGEDDASKAAKLEQLEGLRQQIADGAEFAALAKAHSSCPSKQKGGDLGFFTRGRMAKPFEEAAFGQELNVVGPIVETQFGYHIVEVIDKQGAGMATAEEVTQMLKQRKQQTAVKEYVQSLRAGAEIIVNGQPLPQE